MHQAIALKPQDVPVLVKLIARKGAPWRQVDLAMELGLSQGEIAKALNRLSKAGLVNKKSPVNQAALEFLIFGLKYVFPIELGPLAMGVPTAISAPAHERMVSQSKGDTYVWPFIHGKVRGQSIAPLYPKLPEAVLKDKGFYDLMSAVEIVRMGRARERNLARKFLEKQLGPN